MNIGFDRKVEEIQLFGKQFKIASLTINDLIALDMIDGSNMPDLKSGHLNIHKMLVSICYALSINYEIKPYTWTTNPFKYFAEAYRCAKTKKELSYQNLSTKLTLKNMADISAAIERLNGISDDDTKKKME